MNDMNKRLSEMDYYMKPEKYADGKVDRTGPETAVNIVAQLNTGVGNIFLVGDSEEGFDCDHLEILDEFIGYGDCKDYKERYDEEYDTSLTETLYETKYGNICVVAGESVHGTISIYFANEITRNNLEIGINNVKAGLSAEPSEPFSLTLKPEIIGTRAQKFGVSADSVRASIYNDFEKIVTKYYAELPLN
jgi:hypothetical protein